MQRTNRKKFLKKKKYASTPERTKFGSALFFLAELGIESVLNP